MAANGNGKSGRQLVSEMIGRWALRPVIKFYQMFSIDWTKTDYAFWGRLRRGKERTYSLGALFAKPITETVADWTLGKGFTVKCTAPSPQPTQDAPAAGSAPQRLSTDTSPYTGNGNGTGAITDLYPVSSAPPSRNGASEEPLPLTPSPNIGRGNYQNGQRAKTIGEADLETTQTAVADFVTEYLQDCIEFYENSMAYGDAYLVVNADGSITHVSPETVELICAPPGSQNVVGYRIETKLETMTIFDEYRAEGRTLTIKDHKNYTQPLVVPYENLSGKLPVIHLANDKEVNEVHGRPLYEALLKLFAEYDDVITKSLRGVKIMGNPIPVAQGLEDPEASMKLNSTGDETYTDSEGSDQSKPVIDFSQVEMLWLGKGGSFEFKSPGQFAQDAVALLKKLFYLMLEHTRIPEWVWGGAIASSKASVDAQMPAFELFIDGRRRKLQRALTQLIEVWLATVSLWMPGVRSDVKLMFEWPSISQEDKEIKRKYIEQAWKAGLVTDETHLRLLALVDDPAEEVEAAKDETQEKQAMFQDQTERAIDNELKQYESEGAGEKEAQPEAA